MKQENMTYKSTHERLVSEGFFPEQILMARTRIRTEENGKRYTLLTKGSEESVVYAVDDNIVKEGQRCDKLVLVKRTTNRINPEQWTEIFIELKGRDTNHAINQIRETLKNPIFKHPSNDIIRARIIAQLSLPTNPTPQWKKRNKNSVRITNVTSGG